MPAAIKILKNIEAAIRNTPNGNALIQNRTIWISHINKLKNTEAACLAEAIIDLCYNYTVEDSISNVSKRYDAGNITSFQNDFLKRLKDYWVLYQENNHIFHTGDSNTTQIHEIPLPPWDTAVRIISEDQKLEKYEKTKSFSLNQTPRATDCAKEKNYGTNAWHIKCYHDYRLLLSIYLFFVV